MDYLKDEDHFLSIELKGRKVTTVQESEWKGKFKKPRHLRRDLIPVPYAGNLDPSNGKIFILSINPGLSLLDYSSERSKSINTIEFKRELKKTLKQRFSKQSYPNIFFDPKFWWHPGSNYWQGKLGDIIALYFKKHGQNKNPEEIYCTLSSKFTFLELIPFHSKESPYSCSKMPSVDLMRTYGQKLASIKKKKFLLIVLKGNRLWNIKQRGRNIVNIPSAAQASSIKRGSPIGKAIIKFLKL